MVGVFCFVFLFRRTAAARAPLKTYTLVSGARIYEISRKILSLCDAREGAPSQASKLLIGVYGPKVIRCVAINRIKVERVEEHLKYLKYGGSEKEI